MRIYLDAAPVIYAVEQVDGYFEVVDQKLEQAGAVLIASDLTRLECRMKPLRENQSALLGEYDEFFASAVTETIALSRDVMDGATRIRADYGFRTPDAIHLAAAVAAKCDVFFTNDYRLNSFSELKIEVVSPAD